MSPPTQQSMRRGQGEPGAGGEKDPPRHRFWLSAWPLSCSFQFPAHSERSHGPVPVGIACLLPQCDWRENTSRRNTARGIFVPQRIHHSEQWDYPVGFLQAMKTPGKAPELVSATTKVKSE